MTSRVCCWCTYSDCCNVMTFFATVSYHWASYKAFLNVKLSSSEYVPFLIPQTTRYLSITSRVLLKLQHSARLHSSEVKVDTYSPELWKQILNLKHCTISDGAELSRAFILSASSLFHFFLAFLGQLSYSVSCRILDQLLSA